MSRGRCRGWYSLSNPMTCSRAWSRYEYLILSQSSKIRAAIAAWEALVIFRGQQYVDKGVEFYEAKHREQQIRSVIKRAHQLGLQVAEPAGKSA